MPILLQSIDLERIGPSEPGNGAIEICQYISQHTRHRIVRGMTRVWEASAAIRWIKDSLRCLSTLAGLARVSR